MGGHSGWGGYTNPLMAKRWLASDLILQTATIGYNKAMPLFGGFLPVPLCVLFGTPFA